MPEQIERVEPAEAKHERKERLEAIEAERAGLLDRFLSSRITDTVGNFVPGINAAKMGIEASVGKTMSGKELDGKERLVYALETVSLLIVYAALAEKMHGELDPGLAASAIASKFVANAAYLYIGRDFIVEQLKNFAGGHPEVAALFTAAAGKVAELSPALFSNEIIQLNLNA